MDIKSKNNRRIFWAVMVLALCSLLMLASFSQTKASVEFYVKEVASETEDGGQSWPNYRYNDITDLKSFIRYMYMGSYGMYWELQMKEQGKDLEPDEVYFPGYEDTAENAEEARQAEDHTELLNERIKESVPASDDCRRDLRTWEETVFKLDGYGGLLSSLRSYGSAGKCGCLYLFRESGVLSEQK